MTTKISKHDNALAEAEDNKNEAAKLLKKKWLESSKDINKTLPGHEAETKKLHELKLKDQFDNKFHLSAYSGLINDPNGLHKNGTKYHVFYQWSPFLPIHVNKHWGHFETKDFVSYTHTGLAIAPLIAEEKNGAFSGAALVYQGKSYIFYTGNIKNKNDDDFTRDAYTIVGEWDTNKNVLINKTPLFSVDKTAYTGHFRDPKPFIKNKKFYLLHAAQRRDKTGTLALYESSHVDKDYKHLGELKIKPAIKNPGYMWECPDYFKIGTNEFLVFSTQGKKYYKAKNENRDTVVIVKGKLDIKTCTFHRDGDLQIIDEGFDFYAPQTFANVKPVTMYGWAGASEDSYATFKHMWANNLTMPRVLTYEENRVMQRPHPSLKKLRTNKVKLTKLSYDLEPRRFELNATINKPLVITLRNEKNAAITIAFEDQTLRVDRSKMTYEQSPEFGNIRTRSFDQKINNLQIFIDASLIEIYLNSGAYVFTTKYFIDGKLKLDLSAKITGELYELKPLEVTWNV